MKKNRELLEKHFPQAYIDAGLNATKAYKAIKRSTSPATARVEGSKALANPAIQRSIEALLPKEEETMKVLSDVYKQEREKVITFKDLHKYWETDLKLRGKLNDKSSNTVNVGIIIKE